MKKRFPLPRGAFASMSMPVEQQDALEALAEQQLALAELQLDQP
ncbi:hypothetical protein PR003_g8760 [Phytophthora rubi]|uniref:Uncharacterized protein n=1 Tax=Phytophthora rubi TaxID=129364 RepID=A0A6A3N1G2_9STRA|nr:hypothetical protein PR002_g8658 [Phytophthora rubi]KAE9037511.1 hypothetical protein PR001_g8347 [Phytophthora rubi]KAE9343870.1 hypothetical protein PR003_g8760 [Phytophthora rubi]